MAKRQHGDARPGTSLVAEPPPRRPRRWLRRTLLTVAAAGAAAGVALTLLPREAQQRAPHRPPAPAPGPQARALTAVTTGVPAALPDLTELITRQESAVRARPADARAWAVLGLAYVARANRTADAADLPRAERALGTSLKALATKNTEALAGMTALANARRDFAAAKRYGEQALKLTPKRWSAYPPLIDAYNGLGDYTAARNTLDKLMALRTAPADRPAVMARASAVYRDRGWREDAMAQLTDAAAAAGTPAEQAAYRAGVGQLAWERGDLTDALEQFTEALRLDPAEVTAGPGKARALAARGRTADALTAYREALAKRPDAEVTLELGELYESLHRTRDAEAQYALVRKRAEKSASDGVDEELLLGRLEADHGDPQEAVTRLRAEYRQHPGTEVADALGWALHRAGADKEALKYATAATDRTKGGGVRSALHAFHRGMIEYKLERYGSARLQLEDALMVNPAFSPLWAPEARAALQDMGERSEGPLPADVL
ncbi:tetratricopeptide repeat protein [Streptomyces griseoluteus]|uniref:Tetratricopeptide repeat protein n=1 Tax=Streptomyces griseoluteus TaxID=29306 RepID=A0A4Z1D5B5_STRGP|nr:tetratricopeptide repeat protein [Streptomyces griseoluteus]TGN77396.1 tetratricopeptide repeat protein [Streptomyces griseoluteus]